jgi:hypothetical protein
MQFARASNSLANKRTDSPVFAWNSREADDGF